MQNGQGQLKPGIANVFLANIRFVLFKQFFEENWERASNGGSVCLVFTHSEHQICKNHNFPERRENELHFWDYSSRSEKVLKPNV